MNRPDVLVVGGGLGGAAAAIAACKAGMRVVLTEETDWLGGQLTSQAVPPDENLWIERGACTRSYAELRRRIREIYRANFPLSREAMADPHLNPGQGHVSALCSLPQVGAIALEEMVLPWVAAGRLKIFFETTPVGVSASADGGKIQSIAFVSRKGQQQLEVFPRYVLDATDLGDLLALAKIPYTSGSESREETGELHAHAGPGRPDNVQAFTWCFPLAFDATVKEQRDEYAIERPARYEWWRGYTPKLAPAWAGPLLSLRYSHPPTCQPIEPLLFPSEEDPGRWSLWRYRRILSSAVFQNPAAWNEVSLINWPQNDYMEGNLIDATPEEREAALHDARQLSLSFAYWLQNEAPRPDGGCGYPGLHLRPDITGTVDGFAKAPYIRESRRIRALATVTEQHVGAQALDWRWPEHVVDSVGIGFYPIDLHPTTGGRNYLDIPAYPFQIPLGALIPRAETNLLASAKNIGTTHITNGCYRLHPVEWNIGEAAAMLAALCIERGCTPHEVHATPALRGDLQRMLTRQGVPLAWAAEHKTEYDYAIGKHPLHPAHL